MLTEAKLHVSEDPASESASWPALTTFIANEYTMDSERHAHASAMGADPVTQHSASPQPQSEDELDDIFF